MRTASRKKKKKSTAHKISITSLTPLSAGVWPTLHHLHTLCSFCPFLHPHKLPSPKHLVTKGDVQARWQRNRPEQSSCHGKKTTPSLPGPQEGQHSPTLPAAFWGHTQTVLSPCSCCPRSRSPAHESGWREPERKERASQELKHLRTALLFSTLFFLITRGAFCELQITKVTSGNYGPAPEWTEPLLPPQGIPKILLNVFASHFNFLPSLSPLQPSSSSSSTAGSPIVPVTSHTWWNKQGTRSSENYFSIWVLKPNELTRFTLVVSRINGSYPRIFRQTPYEHCSPKHTHLWKGSFEPINQGWHNQNRFLQC